MNDHYSWAWVEAQVAESVEAWKLCADHSLPALPRYIQKEQRRHEKAYDQGLRAVEREARSASCNPAQRLQAQQRMIGIFSLFAASALGLEDEAVELLTGTFWPVGTQLARRARNFDATLSIADTIQACRNAWIACGLQALLGLPVELTPSILAYSLLYPYSDNYLDQPELSSAEKLLFSERFRQRLRGQRLPARNSREAAVWTMVQWIEEQYARPLYPQVYDCLLAIHQAQEQSIAQLNNTGRFDHSGLLLISCAKGGTSVLADACLAHPWLTPEESKFSFEWGVLLQLGDDLQDVREDLARGSSTLFTRAAAEGTPLDDLVLQLLHFSQFVANRMDHLPNGTPSLKNLLRMSWRLLILMAVADAQPFFSRAFLAELEPCCAFRFDFLRARNKKLAGRQTLYSVLFDACLDTSEDEPPLTPTQSVSETDLCALSGSLA
ncbi:MAG: hypothetical protein ABSF70_09035 [Terracidiphilus sp.]|jgi:hypothetical protein